MRDFLDAGGPTKPKQGAISQADFMSAGVTPHGASGTFGDEPADVPRGTLNDASRALLEGATFGMSPKAVAGLGAIDARARSALSGEAPKPFGQDYRDRLAAERAASSSFRGEHPIADIGLQAAGGIGSAALAGGLNPEADAAAVANVGRGVRLLKSSGVGAGLGAASGFVNEDGSLTDKAKAALQHAAVGAVTAPIMTGLGEAGGWALSKTPLPRIASNAAQSLSENVPSWLPGGTVVQNALRSAASAIGPKGQAASTIANRAAMDTKGGFTAPATAPSVPTMALDAAGPNVEGLAKGVVRSPGAGGATIRNALESRQAGMRPAVESAFDQATGTTAESGERLLNRLATEQQQAESIGSVRTAVARDSRGLRPSVVRTPAQAWQEELGGQGPNGITALQQAVADKDATANHYFGLAKQETQGQPVQSETLEQIRQTPVGRVAENWARAQMGNRGRSLPTVEQPGEIPAQIQAMIDDAKPADRPAMIARAQASLPSTQVEMPNPEMVHYMKQYMAKVARLGVNDGAGGTVATQASGALQQWGQIRNELPPSWAQADAATAEKFRVIDALNQGRNLMRTQLNPAGRGNKALFTSMDAVQQRMAQASPEEQLAFRTGAQSAVTDYLRSGGSPRAFAMQLRDPTSPMSRRVAMALNDDQAPQRLAASMSEMAPQQTLPAPPEASSSQSAIGARQGLSVLQHGTSAPNPERTLPAFATEAASLGPQGRTGLQQGAAQAFRGELAGAGRNVKTPASVFDFSSPERAQQMSYAFRTPEAGAEFQNTIGGWDRAAAQKAKILGGSDTAGNLNEGASRDAQTIGVLSNLFHGRIPTAVGSMLRTASGRGPLDEAIAQMLTSPELATLPNATKTALMRQRIHDLLSRGMAGFGVTETNQQ